MSRKRLALTNEEPFEIRTRKRFKENEEQIQRESIAELNRIKYINGTAISIETWCIPVHPYTVLHNMHGPAEIWRKSNGVVVKEVWQWLGKVHCTIGPAITQWYIDSERKEREEWRYNGELHRVGEPARTLWYENGQVSNVVYFEQGCMHNPSGPAETLFYEDGMKSYESWYYKGKRHRTDGPASIALFPNGKRRWEQWNIHGKRHRRDGPACIEWLADGTKHTEEWRINNAFHHLDGPAIIYYKADGVTVNNEPTSYWIRNWVLSKSEFLACIIFKKMWGKAHWKLSVWLHRILRKRGQDMNTKIQWNGSFAVWMFQSEQGWGRKWDRNEVQRFFMSELDVQ